MSGKKNRFMSLVCAALLCINSVQLPVVAEEPSADSTENETAETEYSVSEEASAETFEELSETSEDENAADEEQSEAATVSDETVPENPSYSEAAAEVVSEYFEEESTLSGSVTAVKENNWEIFDDGRMFFYKTSTEIEEDYVEFEGSEPVHDWDEYQVDKVYLESGIGKIGSYAFANTGLQEIYIPSSVSYLGEKCFSGNGASETLNIYYQGSESEWNALAGSSSALNSVNHIVHCGSYDGSLPGQTESDFTYAVNEDGTYAVTGYTGNESEIEIPSEADGRKITRIEAKVFQNSTGITKITLPDSLVSIGDSAFSGSALRSLHIPAGVSTIGKNPVSYCTDLLTVTVSEENSVFDSRDECNGIMETASDTLIAGTAATVIPENTVKIAADAFEGLSGMESITIPALVTEIGENAFAGCSGLKTVYYRSSAAMWELIAVGEGNEYLKNAQLQASIQEGNFVFEDTYYIWNDGKAELVFAAQVENPGKCRVEVLVQGMQIISESDISESGMNLFVFEDLGVYSLEIAEGVYPATVIITDSSGIEKREDTVLNYKKYPVTMKRYETYDNNTRHSFELDGEYPGDNGAVEISLINESGESIELEAGVSEFSKYECEKIYPELYSAGFTPYTDHDHCGLYAMYRDTIPAGTYDVRVTLENSYEYVLEDMVISRPFDTDSIYIADLSLSRSTENDISLTEGDYINVTVRTMNGKSERLIPVLMTDGQAMTEPEPVNIIRNRVYGDYTGNITFVLKRKEAYKQAGVIYSGTVEFLNPDGIKYTDGRSDKSFSVLTRPEGEGVYRVNYARYNYKKECFEIRMSANTRIGTTINFVLTDQNTDETYGTGSGTVDADHMIYMNFSDSEGNVYIPDSQISYYMTGSFSDENYHEEYMCYEGTCDVLPPNIYPGVSRYNFQQDYLDYYGRWIRLAPVTILYDYVSTTYTWFDPDNVFADIVDNSTGTVISAETVLQKQFESETSVSYGVTITPSQQLAAGEYTVRLKNYEDIVYKERTLRVQEDTGVFLQEGQSLFRYEDHYMLSVNSANLAEMSADELRNAFESGTYQIHFYDYGSKNELTGWQISGYIAAEQSSEDIARINITGLDLSLSNVYARVTKNGANGTHPTADLDYYEWAGGNKEYGSPGIISAGSSGDFYAGLLNDSYKDHDYYGVSVTGTSGYPLEISISRNNESVPVKTIVLNSAADLNAEGRYYFTEDDLNGIGTDEICSITIYAAGTDTSNTYDGYVGTKPIPAQELKGISLSESSVTLKEGSSVQLNIIYDPANAGTDQTPVWSSSYLRVAEVDNTGKVTAGSFGSAEITVTVGAFTATCKVTVIPDIPEEHIYGAGLKDPAVLVIDSEEINNVDSSQGPYVFLANEAYEDGFRHAEILDKTLQDHPGYEAVAGYQIFAMSSAATKGAPYGITRAPADVTEEEADDIIVVPSSTGTPGEDRKTGVGNGYVAFTSGQGFYYVLRKKHIESITLDQTDLVLSAGGDSVRLAASVLPEDTLDDRTVTWTSSDQTVASVDQSGTVTPLSAGNTVIKAEAGGFTAICTVTVTEPLEPQIAINEGYHLVGDDIAFTGSVKEHEDQAVSWTWDFGDGESGEGKNVTHAYRTGGEYDVKLTVEDAYGNSYECIVKCSVIDVNAADSGYSMLKFTVLDSTDASVMNDAVLQITDPEGKETGKLSTDDAGTAQILVENGNYMISIAAPGHRVRNIKVNAAGGTVEQTVTLNSVNFITGDVKVTEMTYEEIVEAGIDVTAPGNQHVYKFETTLTFKDGLKEYQIPLIHYKNENDEEVGEYDVIHYDPKPDPNTGGGWSWTPGPDPDPVPRISVYPLNDKYALVVFGESQWLKEMFQVALVVTNNTETETFEETVAELGLPEGMSLADMKDEAQTLRQELGTVNPKSNASAVWYVRGDEEGDYYISAHVSAKDMPYGDLIEEEFETTEPIHVFAGSALHMTITCDDVAERGKDYTVRYRLENVSDKPVYNISFGLKASGQYTIKRYSDGNNQWNAIDGTLASYEGNERFTRYLPEMAPGGYIEMELTTTNWFFSGIELNEFTVFGIFIDAAYYLEDVAVLEKYGTTTSIPYDIVINETPREYLVDWGIDTFADDLIKDGVIKWNAGKKLIELVGSAASIPAWMIKTASTTLKLQQGETDHVLTVTIDDGSGTDAYIENDVVRITTGDAGNAIVDMLNGTSFKMTARELKFEAKGPGTTKIKIGIEDSYGNLQREYYTEFTVADMEIKDTLSLKPGEASYSHSVNEEQMKLSMQRVREQTIDVLQKNPYQWVNSSVRFELEQQDAHSNDKYEVRFFNEDQSGGGVLWTDKHNHVEISGTTAELDFTREAWQTIAKESGNDFTVAARKLSDEEAEKYAPGAPVYELKVQSGDAAISEFDGTVFVTVPYDFGEAQKANDLYVEHFKADGTSEILDAVYDSENKTVSFTTDSFSVFAIGMKEKEGITLDKASVILSPEETEQLSVNEGKEVTWTSSDENVVTVDEEGKLTAVGTGTATVTAATADGRFTAECKVTVVVYAESMKLSAKEEEILHAGETLDVDVIFTPEEAFEKIAWTSSDETVATVDENGVVTALKSGETTITASNEDGSLSESFRLIVAVDVEGISLDKTEETLYINGEVKDQVQLIETITPENATITDVRWATGNPEVATVDDNGLVSAVNGGTAVITATTVDGEHTAECTVTVIVSVTGVKIFRINEEGEEETVTADEMNIGDTKQFNAKVLPENATNQKIIWESSDAEIAAVDETGLVKALAEGDAVISATSEDGDWFAEVKVAVSAVAVTGIAAEESMIVPVGTQKKIEYVIEPANATNKNVVFESDDEEIVTVSEDGVITGVSRGTAVITLRAEDTEITKEITVNVVPDGIYMGEIERTYEYTGSAIKPEVKVYDRGIELTSSDYTVTYANNVKAGTASITIKMKGNYSGTVTENFVITQIDLGEDERITYDALTMQANGKTLNPVPAVYFNGTKLKSGTDFTIDYNGWDRKTDGDWDLKLIGQGNYTGEMYYTVNVAERSADIIPVTKLKVTAKTVKYQDLSGEDFIEDIIDSGIVTIKNGTKVLKYEDDYEIYEIPEDYRQVGTLKFTISGVGDYYGDRTVSVKITGISINDKKIKNMDPEGYVYTGEAQELHEGFHLTYNGEVMDPEDYEILEDTYTNNLKVGTASVKIEGRNGFTGTRTVKYKITANKTSITAEDITVEQEVPYAKGGAKAAIEVYDTDLGLELIEGTDYTLKYANNKKVGTGTVTVTFKGNFKGTVKQVLNFSIVKKSLEETEMTAKDVVYNSKAGKYKSTPVITDTDGKTLKAGTDYEKAYVYELENEDGTYTLLDAKSVAEAGSVIRVTVKGKESGNYTGEISTEYRILEKGYDISKASITIANQEYTGEAVELVPEDFKAVINKTENLYLDEHFEIVSYKNNVKKGTASVVLRGLYPYGGTKTVKFKIVQKPVEEYWQTQTSGND